MSHHVVFLRQVRQRFEKLREKKAEGNQVDYVADGGLFPCHGLMDAVNRYFDIQAAPMRAQSEPGSYSLCNCR